MPNFFEVNDPRRRKIILSEEIWYGKILHKRPWMVDLEDEIENTVISPLGIFQDVTYKNREVYLSLRSKSKREYLKIVVRFNIKKIGRIISVHTVTSGKSG